MRRWQSRPHWKTSRAVHSVCNWFLTVVGEPMSTRLLSDNCSDPLNHEVVDVCFGESTWTADCCRLSGWILFVWEFRPEDRRSCGSVWLIPRCTCWRGSARETCLLNNVFTSCSREVNGLMKSKNTKWYTKWYEMQWIRIVYRTSIWNNNGVYYYHKRLSKNYS